MAKERRAFSNYPEGSQTRQNNQETFIADDPSFEPEQANFLNGFIGDFSALTAEDLERTPPILEGTAERQKYQLVVGATFIDPATQERESVASYTDLVNQIDSNGGEVSDPNRIFAVDFYAWTPPIDYDKHINFSRYLWIGTGTANVQGEYVTKEQSHSKTVIHHWDGATLTANATLIFNGLPAIMAAGTYAEDASTPQRLVYLSDGATWQLLNLAVVADAPTDFSEVIAPAYFYVARTGPDYQRPIVWKYSGGAGRWIPLPVVINNSLPEFPRENMLWEDSRLAGERVLKFFSNGTFQTLTYTSADGPPGTAGTDGEYIYDTREFETLTDAWTIANWWKHQEDLSPVDRGATDNEDQAIRPIIEFWDGIESVAGDTRDFRNDSPVYKKYAINQTSSEGFDTTEETTIFEYTESVTGQDDPVLGFPLTFDSTGEFLFGLTLESDPSTAIGYHYFLDTNTGLLHGVWHKSDELTNQAVDANGLYDVPVGMSANPDHEILVSASRSRMLRHMTGVIGAQDGFAGSTTGQNSYRWTDRSPTLGASIIDAEETLLRTSATLQDANLDFPDAIRRMAKDYNKVLFRFTNKMNQLWDNLSFTNGNGSLYPGLTATEACDAVLTSIFMGRTEDFPFYNSEMGTFLETLVTTGSSTILDPNPRPIYIPPSPPRVGASPTYVPRSYEQRDGQTVLIGHEGMVIPTFSDERDLIWLNFQNRFFTATPDSFKVESSTFSSRFNEAGITLSDYYGNYEPATSILPVEEVVEDFNTIVGPADGLRVYSTNTAVFALFSAGQWLTRPAIEDDIFLNIGDGEYYIFNGLGTFSIDSWNRPFTFEYTTHEFRQIIRRDFERFIVFRENDFSENTTFDDADPFTWNYRSAGVEGHYVGIYSRVYNSFRPHSSPWEVVGYSVEPAWWRTSYVPDSTDPDGSPRYGNAHPMWADFAAGVVNHPSGSIQNDQFVMAGPVPVDAVGELLDPIAAGVVDNAKLDQQRIDDIWIFGDGALAEQDFLNSSFGAFAIALAGYLMKNGQWTDSLWVSNRIPVGQTGTYPIFNSPHIVNGDTLTRPAISSRPIHLEIIDGVTQVNIGVHAWISEKINAEGGSPTTNFARVVKNTSPALIWKCAGYINEDRTIISTLSRAEIPFSDVHVILHKSQPISQNFSSGVLVAREATGVGYRVFGFDPFDPFFTIERSTLPTTGGQVLLTQDFTVVYTDDEAHNITGGSVYPNEALQHTFEVTDFSLPAKSTAQSTAILAVLVNGKRMKAQHITVDNAANTVTIEDLVELMEGDAVDVQVLTTRSDTSSQIRQFVVNGVSFPYFASGSGEYDQIEYGRFFETATEVINFMLGYGRFLAAQGWKFDTLSEGGATRDWMLGAQRFARWVLDVESIWNTNQITDILDEGTFYYSPIQDEAQFVSPFGQTTSVETIMNGAYGILNRFAEPIKTDGTLVSRIDDRLEVTRTDTSDDETEMFGLRVNLIEAEHVVVFSNITRFNDVIYDPISGLAQRTLVVDSYRTLNWQGRLEADGYILSGGSILPNFEKQAFDFTRFYDRFNTVDDPTKRELARDLYGYVPANQSRSLTTKTSTPSIERRVSSDSSQYMIPVGAADRTRFDYYRGMIQAKGTNRAIYAFTRGTTIGRDRFSINEDWAWKIGPAEFGDTRREVIRLNVNRLDFRDEAQVVNFGDPIDTRDNTIEVLDFDRTDPDNNPRWILPPAECETEDSCNLKFPIDRDTGLIDVDQYAYYAKLYDVPNNINVLNHVQYDPQLEKFDTGATCFLDYRVDNDPARYNAGPSASFSNDRCWGVSQVGSLWWNPLRKFFIPYRDLLPEYEDAAKFWGDLLYYKSTIERPDDDDRTVLTTYDYLDITRTTPVPHGVTVGDTIVVTIRKANQSEYNLTNVEVIATSSTELEFEIESNPDTPATGDPEVVVGHIDIYEWVESPVLPSEWEEYVEGLSDPNHANGTPLDVDDPSFVELTTRTTGGAQTTLYYFWVLNSSGDNTKGKDLTASQISSRIADPVANQVPWFAPVDADNMIIFTDGEKVLDNYGLEILIDQRFLQTHGAFVLFTQGSDFFSVPPEIVEKMADCLAQLDGKGSVVPSPLLAPSERFGSCFFPIQTVFDDVSSAVDVYVSSINRLFSRKNLSEVDILTGIFKLDDELSDTNPDGFWQRAPFVDRRVEGDAVYESVQTIAERDRRFALNLYAEGDIVRVIESGQTDPWTDLEVASNYQLTDGLFIEVGVDNNTAVINSNIVVDQVRFRGAAGQIAGALYFLIYDVLEKGEQNDLIYSLMHEMKVQHPDPRCDWFFKTSYITTLVSTSTDKSPFVRPDEVTAIRDNILNTKPFRTKFRGDVNAVSSAEIEDFGTNLLEFPDKKITLILDRLSCNALDDCGWESGAWDTGQLPCSVWDKPFWDYDDLGRQEYYLLDTITGDNITTKFVVDAIFDPTLYNIKTVVKQDGVEIDADYIVVTTSHTQVFIDTTFSLSPAFTVEVMQSQGFYADADPSFIGTTLDESLFLPAPSDYEHAVPRIGIPPTEFRTVVGGDGNTFTTTSPWIEFYLNSVLLEPLVDYVYAFDYALSTFTAILTVAPIAGDEIAFGFMRGCFDINDPLGGRPEERIVAGMTDSVNICVINDYSQAYLGWDTTPWDVTGWDQGPVNVGRRVFIISVGAQEQIPPGTEFFNTSEDITVVDPSIIMGTSPMSYEIALIELQKGGIGAFVPMTEGVEYGFIGTFNNAIATLVPDQEDFIADGVNFVFATIGGTEIQYVFLNGALKTEGVEYTLDVTRTIITWAQPAPVISPNNSTATSTDEVGDDFTTDFETGQLDNSLNVDNMFVFQNRDLVPTSDYSVVAGVADLRFDTAPPSGDELIFHTVGNNFADNTAAFVVDTITSFAGQTIFNTTSGGWVSSEATWVFVAGKYQVEGTDYTVTGTDQITLTAPLAGGIEVEIRTIDKGIIDVSHIVFTSTATNGAPTDVIPGLNDANPISRTLVFVDNEIQNGWKAAPENPDYTIVNTNPDTITWNVRKEKTELDWGGIDGTTLPTGAVPAAYFDISSTIGDYRLWFSDGSTTIPAAGGRILDAIVFDSTETDQEISDLVQMKFVGNREFTDLDWTGVTGGTLPTGAVPAAYFDISTTTTTYRFWFSDGLTTPPIVAGEILVPVSFAIGDADLSIAATVASHIDGADPQFRTSDALTIVHVKVVSNGPVADAVDGAVPTGVSITVVRQGDLIPLDTDFVNAHNGGGTSRTVSVEIATGGAVADAVDGAVPTVVGIEIIINGNDVPAGSDISVRVIRTIQMSTTLSIDVHPTPGMTVSAQFVPFIEAADVVRYTFNGWPTGPLGGYTVDAMVAPLGTSPYGYDIVKGILKFDTIPPENLFFSVTYNVSRPNGMSESILVRMENIVADILPDHESYNPPNGFDTSLGVGTQIINTTTNMTYTWDGTVWNADPVLIPGTQFYVTRHQQIWNYDGVSFNLLFNVGDPFTKPPVVNYPAFGAGIRYATYAYGTSTDALAQWPDAFYIMEHPGECPNTSVGPAGPAPPAGPVSPTPLLPGDC
jgi:hypothetical protein